MCWVARLLLPAAVTVAWQVAAETRIRVGAPDGRVPLRIAPDAAAEAAWHVPSGTEIDALDDASNAWIRVAPPPQAHFWIYAELVRGGSVSVNRALVRAGAGLSHKAVTSLNRGTAVQVRGRLGDWLRIAAPTGVVLWVAGELAAAPAPPQIMTPATADDETAVTNEPAALPPSAIPSPLRLHTLASGRTQGEVMRLRGRLDWSSQWRRDRPVSFNLLGSDLPDEAHPLCQMVASAAAYETLVGCDVEVTGSHWWLADDPLPVLIVDRLEAVASGTPDALSFPTPP